MTKRQATARKYDHAAIFWHIAGSYSPLTLIGMRNGGESEWAWIIFAMVWVSAIVGTCLSFRKMKSQSYLETTCYVLKGFPDGYSIKNADKTVLFADFWVILCRNGKVCLWDTMILY